MGRCLSQVETCLEVTVRSALLLYLIAVLHLVLHVLPLRSGCRRRNAAITSCRRGLRGAPLLLACFCTACLVPQAQAMRANTACTWIGKRNVPGHPPPTHGPQDYDQKFEVYAMRLQKSASITTQWWDEGLTASYVCRTASLDLSFAPPNFPGQRRYHTGGGAYRLADLIPSPYLHPGARYTGALFPCSLLRRCFSAGYQGCRRGALAGTRSGVCGIQHQASSCGTILLPDRWPAGPGPEPGCSAVPAALS